MVLVWTLWDLGLNPEVGQDKKDLRIRLWREGLDLGLSRELMHKKPTVVLGAMVQAAHEAGRRGEDADCLSANPFYKEASEVLDAVRRATTLLVEN